MIINWIDPTNNKPVFSWHQNKNYSNVSHNHIEALNIGKSNKEHTHYPPGSLIPEPFATIYFNGGTIDN